MGGVELATIGCSVGYYPASCLPGSDDDDDDDDDDDEKEEEGP